MKKMLLPVIVLVVVLGSFFLPATQPAIASAVVLPEALAVGIQALFVFAAGWAFAQIGIAMPWFVKMFGQYADEIAFAFSAAVIGLIQNYLDMIPPLWDTPANLFLGFIVAVLTALQVFKLLGKLKVPSFRA
jgi:hypothetical protein